MDSHWQTVSPVAACPAPAWPAAGCHPLALMKTMVRMKPATIAPIETQGEKRNQYR